MKSGRSPFEFQSGNQRHRLDIGEESLAAAGLAGDASEKEVPEDGGDVRTLPVEVDATGRRCQSWRSAVKCSSTYGHDIENFEGLPSVLRLIEYFLQIGGDPRFWLQRWPARPCSNPP